MTLEEKIERLIALDRGSEEFYANTEEFIKKILLPGEHADFKMNANGVFYDILIDGIERSKDDDIVFHAHTDCGYGTTEYSIRQLPSKVALECANRLRKMIPELQANRERKKWFKFFKSYLKDNFKFWQKLGKNVYEALRLSIDDTSKVKKRPFEPNAGVDKKVLDDFLHKWKQALKQLEIKVKNGTYDEGNIRLCEVCGLPMFEGYYLDGEYACDEECCLEKYNGDKAQMEEDLSHAEENFGECYWTEWDSVFFDY